MSPQREAGCRVQSLGEGIHQLTHGAEVLAVPVAKIHQAEAGEREGIRLPPQALIVLDGERVGAGHFGAVCRVRRPGCRRAYYSASVTLLGV